MISMLVPPHLIPDTRHSRDGEVQGTALLSRITRDSSETKGSCNERD